MWLIFALLSAIFAALTYKLSVVITLILAFIFLHEEFTAKSLIGCMLITAGTLIMVL